MKGKVELAWQERAKVLRSAVRLKYSLLADREINERIDTEKQKFDRAVQNGRLPAPLDPKMVLNG